MCGPPAICSAPLHCPPTPITRCDTTSECNRDHCTVRHTTFALDRPWGVHDTTGTPTRNAIRGMFIDCSELFAPHYPPFVVGQFCFPMFAVDTTSCAAVRVAYCMSSHRTAHSMHWAHPHNRFDPRRDITASSNPPIDSTATKANAGRGWFSREIGRSTTNTAASGPPNTYISTTATDSTGPAASTASTSPPAFTASTAAATIPSSTSAQRLSLPMSTQVYSMMPVAHRTCHPCASCLPSICSPRYRGLAYDRTPDMFMSRH